MSVKVKSPKYTLQGFWSANDGSFKIMVKNTVTKKNESKSLDRHDRMNFSNLKLSDKRKLVSKYFPS